MRKGSRLILALDETDWPRALAVAESVAGVVDAVKVNWPLVLSEGPSVVTRLSELSDVICDFKVADVPNTVRLIVEGAVSRGASGVIVHAFTGDDSLRAAVEAAGGADVYAVTEMSHPGALRFTAPHAEEMARMGVECGVSGFVAPATRPDRIRAVRGIAGPGMTIISPGVGAQGGSAADAVLAGADYAIVGRSIYGAADPRAAAEAFAEEISSALRPAGMTQHSRACARSPGAR